MCVCVEREGGQGEPDSRESERERTASVSIDKRESERERTVSVCL